MSTQRAQRTWRRVCGCIVGAAVAAGAACGPKSDSPPTAPESSSTSGAADTDTPAAEPGANPHLRISTKGVDYEGTSFDILVDGVLPNDPDGIERVKPAVAA